jgi:hypothetical protein
MPRLRRIELAVTCGVIAVLLSLLILAIYRARESAKQVACGNNLKQLSLAVYNYSDTFKRLPFGTVGSRALPPEKRFSWYVGIWPFLEGGIPTLLIDQSAAWDADVNREPRIHRRWKGEDRSEIVKLPFFGYFSCPSAEDDYHVHGVQFANYVGLAGIGTDAPIFSADNPDAGIWGFDRQVAIDDIEDGTSATMLFLETNSDTGPWLAGGHTTVRGLDEAGMPYLGRSGQFGGLHPNGCQAALADASTKLLSNTTDPAVLEAMTTFARKD